ncbi:MAG: hypothetical protein Q9173_000049 [Seirophora scorigena]
MGDVDLDDASSANAKYGTTQRGLKSRHIQLIALGGCIGTYQDLGIIGLIFVGNVLFFGGGPNKDRLGFRYWQRPGALIPFAAPGNTGKFVSSGSATVFQWFVNLTTISGNIAWIILLITYLQFRRALEFNGLLDQRPYRVPGQPYVIYVALSVLVILTLTNGFQVFFPSKFTASSFLAAYITLPTVIVLYLGH